MSLRDRMQQRLRCQAGFTLFELLISVLVLSLAVGGLLALVEGSRASTTRSEKREVAANLGEKEIERLEALNYATPAPVLALTAAPAASTDPDNPNYYRSSCGSPAAACYRWDQSGSAAASPLVVDAANGDSTANPQAASVPAPSSGTRINAQIYRYITWVDDPSCTTARCAGSTDYKRLTVVVTVDGGPKKTIVSSIVSDTAGAIENPLKNGTTVCTDGATVVTCVH